MKFTKMHGLGNDFIVMVDQKLPEKAEEIAVKVCNRHTGVGADGLVYILPSDHADFQMRIFNSDGSEAQQCGNAIRCVSKYYYERINGEQEKITVETKRGIQPVWLTVTNEAVKQVRVDMGEPILQPKLVPIVSNRASVVEEPVDCEGRIFSITAVSMGNPYAVIEVDDVNNYPVAQWGAKLEVHPVFPERANIEFATYHSAEEITMRVWERGVGETNACGSGACAVLVAGVLCGKASRRAIVHLRGGDLQIEWSEEDNRVYMTGPAAYVFEGEWNRR